MIRSVFRINKRLNESKIIIAEEHAFKLDLST